MADDILDVPPEPGLVLVVVRDEKFGRGEAENVVWRADERVGDGFDVCCIRGIEGVVEYLDAGCSEVWAWFSGGCATGR